jgi:Arc-like DNA binding domain
MKSTPARPKPKLNVRFDDEDLRRQISEAAKKSCRSLNCEIIFRLRQTFQSEETAAA